MSAHPREILDRARTIAVVGASTQPWKAAYSIPAALQAAGFTVIPVNPNADEVLGERSYARLRDVPATIDVVNVFRPPAECAHVARQAVEVGAGALWLQLGITSAEARDIAEQAGLDYVEDLCMGVAAQRWGIVKR